MNGVMRAVRFDRTGGPEVLRCEELPVPSAGPGQVLVRVLSAGVNYADVLRRAGRHYPVPTPLPFTIGSEVAGEVVACGQGVDVSWQGRRVLAASITGGGYAQYIALPFHELLPWPDGLEAHTAGALLIQGTTAAVALLESGQFQAGESVLVLGAAGGVGSLLVQLARARGTSTVIGGARGAERGLTVQELGAQHVDYSQPGWSNAVLKLTDGRGVDLMLDATAGDLLREGALALAEFGRIVLYGTASPTPDALDLSSLITRNQRVTGCFLGRHLEQRPAHTVALLREMGEHVRSGEVKPLIHAVLPLAEANKAHALLESRQAVGKLLLDPWM